MGSPEKYLRDSSVRSIMSEPAVEIGHPSERARERKRERETRVFRRGWGWWWGRRVEELSRPFPSRQNFPGFAARRAARFPSLSPSLEASPRAPFARFLTPRKTRASSTPLYWPMHARELRRRNLNRISKRFKLPSFSARPFKKKNRKLRPGGNMRYGTDDRQISVSSFRYGSCTVSGLYQCAYIVSGPPKYRLARRTASIPTRPCLRDCACVPGNAPRRYFALSACRLSQAPAASHKASLENREGNRQIVLKSNREKT